MTEREIFLYNSLKGLHLLDDVSGKKCGMHKIVNDLLGVQSQFASYAELSLFLRTGSFSHEKFSRGFYKIYSHRGTMHVVSEEELGLHVSAYAYPKGFCDMAWGIPLAEAERWSDFIISMIKDGKETRNELKDACRKNGACDELLGKIFYGWGGLVCEMIHRGKIVCMTGNGKKYAIPREFDFMDVLEARKIMVRRYFENFGPASMEDCMYFFGKWKKNEMEAVFESVLPGLCNVRVDGKVYYYRGRLVKKAEIPPCVLVPGFDQLVLGYRNRSRMIDEKHLGLLTNSSGIVHPSVIVGKRIRASWKIDGKKILVKPFEELSADFIHDIETCVMQKFPDCKMVVE